MDCVQPPPRAVIFDLGDVLFAWSAKTTTTIPSRKLRDILSTAIWSSYDRGEITRDTCYELSGLEFSLSASEIAEAFAQARKSIHTNPGLIDLIHTLKQDSAVNVYAMSNIGREDFEGLSEILDWSLFDRVFTSAAAGMRKPELRFYHYVLDQIGLAGSQVIFIDDKEENVNAAREVDIRSLVSSESTVVKLRQMFESPAARGWRWLFRNAKRCNSVTDNGVSFADNFAKLLILDTLLDQ
jgi:HAD superfamily hydrolase (TIGR01509 family)